MREGLLIGLKAYKTTVYSKKIIAGIFPKIFAEILKSFMTRNAMGDPAPIGYDWNKIMEFQINMGTIIDQEKFDYLDNVVLQFLKSYSFVIPPYRFFIELPEEEIIKYTTICDGFKGKSWDDIIDVFIDATYNLFKTGTMRDQPLE